MYIFSYGCSPLNETPNPEIAKNYPSLILQVTLLNVFSDFRMLVAKSEIVSICILMQNRTFVTAM